MAVLIDTAGPLRRPSDLHDLVAAVVAAGNADESSWIEWKSSADLTTPAGAFKVARSVLGFANRDPVAAGRHTGGLAYLVVGAEPGSVVGIAEIDLASVEDALRPYLGNDGPTWGATYVRIEDKHVLVITVEAPSPGDPIYALRKTYQGERGKGGNEGTVFVRGLAATQPASASDIDMLQSRLRQGSVAVPSLDLDVDWSPEGFTVASLDVAERALDDWVDARRQTLLARPSPSPPVMAVGNIMGALNASGSINRDSRTAEEFDAELEAHLQACRTKLVACLFDEVVNQSLNRIVLRVANPTTRNLTAVELTLRIDGAAALECRDERYELKMPRPPRVRGWVDIKNSLLGLTDQLGLAYHSSLVGLGAPALMPRRSRVLIDHVESMRTASVTLELGDMRPDSVVETEAFMLVVNAGAGTVLDVEWRATSTKVDAIQTGALPLPVGVAISPLALVPVTFDSDA